MHWFPRLIVWVIVLGFIPVVTSWIPKEESTLRTLLALTFLLWILVGLALAIRGTFRFLTR